MKPPLWLPLTVAKCLGTACKYTGRCATREILYEKGRPLTDHSVSAGMYMAAPCSAPNWLKRIDPANAVKPAEKPIVKEWIGQ